MKKLWDSKKLFSNLEPEGQGQGTIMGVTRLLLLELFYIIQTQTGQTFWRGSHRNVFFPLWTDSICPFRYPFREKLASQMLHLKGFFPLWTDSICPFRCNLWAKALSHTLHLKGFLPLWMESICLFKTAFAEKLWSQMSHLNGFFPYFYISIACPGNFIDWISQTDPPITTNYYYAMMQ